MMEVLTSAEADTVRETINALIRSFGRGSSPAVKKVCRS